ncbi:MAG: hypothetical protein ACK5NY_03525 [Burkholderiaceae bacterium]
MSIIIKSGASGNLASVDASNNLQVTVNGSALASGFVALSGESDPGAVTGTRLIRQLDVSNDYRIRTGCDSPLFNDVFSYGTVNAGVYAASATTATIVQANGLLTLNSGNSTASGAVAQVRTYAHFPTLATFPTYVQFLATTINGNIVNKVLEMGLGYASGTTGPTDGAFFRWNAAGELRGVLVNNSVERQTGVIAQQSDNVRAEYLIVFDQDRVEFWINQVLQGALDLDPTTAAGNGMLRSQSMPVFTRMYNSAATSSAAQLSVGYISVSRGDMDTTRLWSTAMAVMGNHGLQSPPGAASAQLANYVNSTGPVSATLSNTAAGYSALGGQFQFAAVAGAETDYALFAYQVPAGSVTQPARNLIVRNIRIDTVNTGAAVATTATLLQWAAGTGSTAVSLATTDSLTAAGRAPRRIALGIQSFPIGAAIAAQATPIDLTFDASPLVVEPGCFLHVILKMPIGTATASQVIRGVVTVCGYFE